MLVSLASVFLDYKCNFHCRHCSVGSSPKNVFPMPDSVFDRVLSQLKENNTIQCVVFTGGEATLRYDMLLKGLRACAAEGIRTRLVTNAWWAKTYEKALAYLRVLQENGLDELNTSFDDFHEEFISIDRIINAIKAAKKLEMPIGVGVICDKDGRWSGEAVRRQIACGLQLKEEELEREKIFVLSDYATPVGSGRELNVEGCDGGQKTELGCMEIMKSVSFHPDGTVRACCGHVMFYERDLIIGDILREDLKDIINRAQKNLFYWWIHMNGPRKILQKLGCNERFASPCHACQKLLSEYREVAIDYLKKNKEDVFLNDVILSDYIIRFVGILANDKRIIENKVKSLVENGWR